MADVAVGIFAILAGLLLCSRGYLAMRVVIPIWGALTGFFLGAGLITSFTDEGFLASLLGWVVGLVVGAVFGLLAYLYFEISVFIAMAAIGFVLGTGSMVALGVSWSWVIILVGLAVGALLAWFAIVGDLPMVFLAVLTSLAGASVVISGLMLMFNVVSLDDFDSVTTTRALDDQWWWYAIYAGLAIAGFVAQLRSTMRLRGSLRAAWSESGGREFKRA